MSQLGVASPRVVRYVILSVCPVVMSPVEWEASTFVTIGAAVSIFRRGPKKSSEARLPIHAAS